MKVVYFTGKTRNTLRFVTKLGLPDDQLIRIPEDREGSQKLLVDKSFILILPTYADGSGAFAVPIPVELFMGNPENARNIKAVISSGRKSFGATYACAGDVISHVYSVPLLHKFELFGMPSDVRIVLQRIQECQ